MNIDDFKPAIVYTIYIASTPEKVWEALTTAEFCRKYFSGFAIEADLSVGGAFIVREPDGSEHIRGEVIECDPPKKLTFTLNVNWPELTEKLGPTLVTYEIEPTGDAVRLTMTQSHDRPISDDILSGGRRLARDFVEPEELAGDRKGACDQDGAAGADDGGAEGVGNRDAVALDVVRAKRAGKPRAASAGKLVVAMGNTITSRPLDGLRSAYELIHTPLSTARYLI